MSCNRGEDGELSYKSTYNLNIQGLNKKRGEINALIAFENKHASQDYKLKDINLDITVDGIDIGTYYSRQTLHIKAQSELKVPLVYGVDNTKLQNGDGTFSPSFIVQLQGAATFTNAQGEDVEIEFTHKETVHPIVPKKEKRQLKKQSIDSDEEGSQLKKSEQRKLKRLQRKESKE